MEELFLDMELILSELLLSLLVFFLSLLTDSTGTLEDAGSVGGLSLILLLELEDSIEVLCDLELRVSMEALFESQHELSKEFLCEIPLSDRLLSVPLFSDILLSGILFSDTLFSGTLLSLRSVSKLIDGSLDRDSLVLSLRLEGVLSLVL